MKKKIYERKRNKRRIIIIIIRKLLVLGLQGGHFGRRRRQGKQSEIPLCQDEHHNAHGFILIRM